MASWKDYPGAPAVGTCLAQVNHLLDGEAESFSCGSGPHLFQAFLLRWRGAVQAYVNDCPHAHTPLDWQPGRLLDTAREWLVCATHGAKFDPATGLCIAGPCKGKSLTPVPIRLSRRGRLYN